MSSSKFVAMLCNTAGSDCLSGGRPLLQIRKYRVAQLVEHHPAADESGSRVRIPCQQKVLHENECFFLSGTV